MYEIQIQGDETAMKQSQRAKTRNRKSLNPRGSVSLRPGSVGRQLLILICQSRSAAAEVEHR